MLKFLIPLCLCLSTQIFGIGAVDLFTNSARWSDSCDCDECRDYRDDCCDGEKGTKISSALQAEGTATIASTGPFPVLLTYSTQLKHGNGIDFDGISTFYLRKNKIYQVTYGAMLGADVLSARLDLYDPSRTAQYDGSAINLLTKAGGAQEQVDKTVLLWASGCYPKLQARLTTATTTNNANITLTDSYISIIQLIP